MGETFFSVLRDVILDSIHVGIKNCESSRESRLTVDCQLSFERYRNRGFTVFPKTNT